MPNLKNGQNMCLSIHKCLLPWLEPPLVQETDMEHLGINITVFVISRYVPHVKIAK